MKSVRHDQYMQHFSHRHLLELTNPGTQTTNPALITPCSACKLQSSGSMYTCNTCNNFTLHVSCAQMPQLIAHHQSHPSHPLSLLPKTIHPHGFFRCDGCGHHGDGFSYRCDICDFDLHVLCVSKPLTMTHHSHHHQLRLTFASPYYPTTGFDCNICGQPGDNQWLYRCSSCEFDAHLDCATNVNPTRPVLQPWPHPQPQHYPSFPGANQAPLATGMNHNPFIHHGQSTGASQPLPNNYQRPSTVSRILNAALSIPIAAAQGLAEAAGQVIGQEIAQDLTNYNHDNGGNNQDPGYNDGRYPDYY